MAKQKNQPAKKTSTSSSSSASKRLVEPFQIDTSFWKKNWIGALIVFFVAVALYFQVRQFEFVLDDQIVITDNVFTKKGLKGIDDIFRYETFTGYFKEQKDLVEGARYRPLSLATFAIEGQIFAKPKLDSAAMKPLIDPATGKAKMDTTTGKTIMDPATVNPIKDKDGDVMLDLGTETKITDPDPSKRNRMAGIMHFINVLLYALTGLLLYRLLGIMLPLPKEKAWWASLPFVGALLFVLHPLHVEAVANVKGRDEILALMGALAALYFTFRYAGESPDNKKSIWLSVPAGLITVLFFYCIIQGKSSLEPGLFMVISLVTFGLFMVYSRSIGMAFLTFLLGLLAKENTITFVAAIPLACYFFTNLSWSRIGTAMVPVLAATMAFLGMRYSAIGYFLGSKANITDLMNDPFIGMSGLEKFGTIMLTLGWYIKLLFWPWPLTHDYYPYHVPKVFDPEFGTMPIVWSLLSMALYAVLLWVALKQWNRRSVLSFSILYWLITISIVSNLALSVGTFMNERFIYTSSVAFSILAGWFITVWVPKYTQTEESKVNVYSLAVLGILSVIFSYYTLKRIPDWIDAAELNYRASEVSPNSCRSNTFITTTLFEIYKRQPDTEKKKALLVDMTKYIDKSLAIYPEYYSAAVMKSGIAAEVWKFDKDDRKLFGEFTKLLTVKYKIDFIEQFSEYMVGRSDPKAFADFAYNIGYEVFAKKQKNYEYAIKYLQLGLKAAPGDVRLNWAIGKSYQLKGDEVSAKPYLDKAFQIDPIYQGL